MQPIKLELTYNPYKVKSDFFIDGKVVDDGPLIDLTLNKRLQQWVDKLLEEFFKFNNSTKVDFVFTGTLLDSEDVKDAVLIYTNNNPSKTVNLSLKTTDETVGNKVTQLQKLYDEAKKGPFDEFRSKEMKISFTRALAPEFEVNVIATMSAGKSTVINAMLGKELMPAKNEACTATIAKITDHDGMKQFTARRKDATQDIIDDWQKADAQLIAKWNGNKNTSIIEIKGDIPAIQERESVRIVLVDTPGPNNSRDGNHRYVTRKAITDHNMSMVLYILNATQLSTDDDRGLLSQIKDAMKAGGREAQDRFIFIANKIDNFDPENGESIAKALDNVRGYLQDNGIKNPLIVPASAVLALLSRLAKFEGIASLTRSKKGTLRNFSELFREVPDMNMLEHVKKYLSKNTYNKINHHLQTARNNSEESGEVEILSGIPIIETLLDNFIEKHAIPAKLKDAVDSFAGVMTKAKGLKKLENLINRNTSELQDITEKMTKFAEDKSKINQAELFKEKVKKAKYELSRRAKKSKNKISKRVNSLLDELQTRFEGSVKQAEAKMAFKKAERGCEDLFDEIEETLTEDLKNDQLGNLNHFMDDYQKFVSELLEKAFPDTSDIDIKEFQAVALTMPDSKTLIAEATYEETTKTFIRTERHGFLWLKQRDIYERHTEELVDMSEPWDDFEHSIRTAKRKNLEAFEKSANQNFDQAKSILLMQMEVIDKKMSSLMASMNKAATDKKEKEKMIAECQTKQEWYKSFTNKLDDILAI